MTTKKHFILASNLIREWKTTLPEKPAGYVIDAIKANALDDLVRRELAMFAAKIFQEDNPRFDKARFYAASGVVR